MHDSSQAPPVHVAAGLAWPALLAAAAARRESPLFAEWHKGAATSLEVSTAAPTSGPVNVLGKVRAIAATVLGRELDAEQPLMEVIFCR